MWYDYSCSVAFISFMLIRVNLLQTNIMTMHRLKTFIFYLFFVLFSSNAISAVSNAAEDAPTEEHNNKRIRRTGNDGYSPEGRCPGFGTATEALGTQPCYDGICDQNIVLRGRDGQDGQNGLNGRDGRDGKDGRDGEAGPKGEDMPNPGSVGSTYVLWGRTTCPSTAEIVYEGLAGGGNHAHPGGGSNFLCLPYDPDYLRVEVGQQGRGVIYSSEYETNGFPTLSHLQNYEVPCAVCHAERRGTVLMIPAKTECPSDWTEEYQGYLMTEHYNHPASRDFICVDENAEARPDSNAGNQNGALLYMVEGRCDLGNLPCRPYIDGNELACVVCTK